MISFNCFLKALWIVCHPKSSSEGCPNDFFSGVAELAQALFCSEVGFPQ